MEKKRQRIAGFEVIGSIAVLQLRKPARELKKIASKILAQHKNIETVAYKTHKVSGRLRKRKLKILAGKKSFTTMHRENNCLIELNIESCYFSPRLANERLEISKKIKGTFGKGAAKIKILVMFAGVAPYALAIAKLNPKAQVQAIELNKAACRYAAENVKLNKLSNIKIIQGDIKKTVPKLKEKFDVIVMPRPQLKDTFLKEAFKVSKKGTIIFFYDFLDENQINIVKEKIEKEAAMAGKRIKILNVKKAGEVAPYRCRIRTDFRIV